MSALHHRLRLLGRVLLALQACFLATRATVVEIDMIFPRNETYDPGPLLPVVFAIRNSAMATSLDMSIVWNIRQLADPGVGGTGGGIDLKKANFTGADPFFEVDYGLWLNGTEQGWVILWDVAFDNCSRSNPSTKVTRNSETRRTFFSTKRGAPAPNLVQGPGVLRQLVGRGHQRCGGAAPNVRLVSRSRVASDRGGEFLCCHRGQCDGGSHLGELLWS